MITDDITYPSYESFPQEEEGISSHRVKINARSSFKIPHNECFAPHQFSRC